MVNKIDGNNYYKYSKLNNVNIPNTDEKFSLDYKQDELQSNPKNKKEKEVSDEEKKKAAERSGVRLELSGSGQAAATDRRKSAEQVKHQSAVAQSSLLESIQTFFETAIAAVKDFFYKLWNDPQPEDAAQASSEIAESIENAKITEAIENAEIIGNTNITDMSEMTDVLTKSEPVGTAAQVETAGILSGTSEGMERDALAAYRRNEERLNREIQPYLRNGDLNQVISLLTDNGKKTTARNSTLLTYYDRNGRMVEPSASDRERILYGDRNTRKL